MNVSPDPFVVQVLAESMDTQEAINRLLAKNWEEEEAITEITRVLATQGARNAIRQRGARDGRT